MSDELLSREEGAVHRLTLNRPARRNALTPDLAAALARELELIEERGAAHVVVLGGAGGHFCAGLDLHWLRSLGSVPSVAELQRGLGSFQSAVLAIVRCPMPVVAELRGTAAGFGLDLALACDMRIAAAGATFTSAFARMGLVPDGGSTFTLPRLLGLGHALRFLMAGETVERGARRCARPGGRGEGGGGARRRRRRARQGHRRRRPRPASARSSAWCGPRRWARWSRPLPRRARPRSRRCRAPSSSGGWKAFVVAMSAPAAPGSSRPTCWPDRSRWSPAAAPASGSASPSCLAAAGATVAIASRKPEHLAAAAEALRAGGAKVTTVETNVREPEAVARMVRGGGRRARPDRPAGEQRRRQLLRALRHAVAQCLARRGGDRPLRHVLLLPRRCIR